MLYINYDNKKGEILWLRIKLCLYVVIVGMNRQNGWGNVHGCNEWNSFYEEKLVKSTGTKYEKKKEVAPTVLNELEGKDVVRNSCRIYGTR